MRRTLLSLGVGALTLFIGACGAPNGTNSIVGSWVSSCGYQQNGGQQYKYLVKFEQNQTFTFSMTQFSGSQCAQQQGNYNTLGSGTYTADGSRLTTTFSGQQPNSVPYTLNGNQLTFVVQGQNDVWSRQ